MNPLLLGFSPFAAFALPFGAVIGRDRLREPVPRPAGPSLVVNARAYREARRRYGRLVAVSDLDAARTLALRRLPLAAHGRPGSAGRSGVLNAPPTLSSGNSCWSGCRSAGGAEHAACRSGSCLMSGAHGPVSRHGAARPVVAGQPFRSILLARCNVRRAPARYTCRPGRQPGAVRVRSRPGAQRPTGSNSWLFS